MEGFFNFTGDFSREVDVLAESACDESKPKNDSRSSAVMCTAGEGDGLDSSGAEHCSGRLSSTTSMSSSILALVGDGD